MTSPISFNDLPDAKDGGGNQPSAALSFDDLPEAKDDFWTGPKILERAAQPFIEGARKAGKFASTVGEAFAEPWQENPTWQTTPEEEEKLKKIPETGGLQFLARTGVATGKGIENLMGDTLTVPMGIGKASAEFYGASPEEANRFARDVGVAAMVAPMAGGVGARAPEAAPRPVEQVRPVERPVEAAAEPVMAAGTVDEAIAAAKKEAATVHPETTGVGPAVQQPYRVISFDDLPDVEPVMVRRAEPQPAQPIPQPAPDLSPYIADINAARAPLPKEQSLFDTIRAMGGIRPEPDVAAILQDFRNPPFKKRLTRPEGVAPDDVRRTLQEGGWFGRDETLDVETGRRRGDDIQDLYDLMDREARGEAIYHPESKAAEQLRYRQLLDEDLARAGVATSDDVTTAARKLKDYRDSTQAEIDAYEQSQALDAMGKGSLTEEEWRRLESEYGDEPIPEYETGQYVPGADVGAEYEAPRSDAGYVRGPEDLAPDQGETPTSYQRPRETGRAVEGPARAAELAVEPGAEGLPQTIIPGAEQSARQLAAAREAAGHGRKVARTTQKQADQGLFAPAEPEEPTLFQRDNPQTNTPEFKRWFGDSKVVDEKGGPLVVYHGSAADVKVFDPARTGEIQTSDWGDGVYFTPSRGMADLYREHAAKETSPESARLWKEYENEAARLGTSPMMATIDLGFGTPKYKHLQEFENRWRQARKDAEIGGSVYPAYLKIERPLNYTYEGITDPFLARRAKETGHDGLIIRNESGDVEEIIAFRPEQIKSAIGNQGTFDPNNPNISMQRGAGEATAGERVALNDRLLANLPENPSPEEAAIIVEVDRIAQRIVPGAKVRGARTLQARADKAQAEGFQVYGATYTNGARRLIAWSLESPHPTGTLRHEAVHWLRNQDVITRDEWTILSKEAERKGWVEKHNIEERYPDLTREQKLEEAIAEEYAGWARNKTEAGSITRRIFARVRDLLDQVAGYVRERFGRDATVEDVFRRFESGEVGRRAAENEIALGNGFYAQMPEYKPGDVRNGYDVMASIEAAKKAIAEGKNIDAVIKRLGEHGIVVRRDLLGIANETKPANVNRKPTPSTLTPVSGTGGVRPRGLSEHIEATAAEKALTEGFEEIPTYRQVSMAEQSAAAQKIVDANYEAAKAIAMGRKAAPRDVLPEAVLNAVERKALEDGDAETIRQLATQSRLMTEATTMGQRIRTLGERNQASPVAAIQAIQEARAEALKMRKTEPVAAAEREVGVLKKEVRRRVSVEKWSEFVGKITCGY